MLLNQSVGKCILQTNPVIVNKGSGFPTQGHESLTLAFCLATRRCMTLGSPFTE